MSVQFRYTAGQDNLESILKELEDIFPRWYFRGWSEASLRSESLTVGDPHRGKSWQETVRDYLRQELLNHPEPFGTPCWSRAGDAIVQGGVMIPQRVRLRGFLCYKDEQIISFDGASLW